MKVGATKMGLEDLLGGIAGGGLGILKTLTDLAGRQNELNRAGTTARWSPWTKLEALEPRKVNAASNILGGALSGAKFGQEGFNKAAGGAISDVGNAIGAGAKGLQGGLWKLLGLGGKEEAQAGEPYTTPSRSVASIDEPTYESSGHPRSWMEMLKQY